MVYVAANRTPGEITVALTSAFVDQPQPVLVRIGGFDFPGEVIFADQWQAWFGTALPERTMFRLVLLSENQRVDLDDIASRFIAVAVPPAQELSNRTSEFTQLNRELARLDEIREQYVVSSDYGLHSLAASLTDNTSRAQRSITEVLSARWRTGTVIAHAHDMTYRVQPDSIFVGEDPAAWVEAIAATMFTRQVTENGDDVGHFDPEDVFAGLLRGSESEWRDHLESRVRLATGCGIDEVTDQLDALSSGDPEVRIDGEALRDLLLRQHGLPAGLASLLSVAYFRSRDGEAEISARGHRSNERLDSHSLGTQVYDPELIYSMDWLSPRHRSDWNSALPYIRVLLPHAGSASTGEPTADVERQFMQSLEVASTRVTLTLHTLETISGPAVERLPAVELTRRLASALEAGDWKTFYTNARAQFPAVADFADAVAESSRLRALSEDIVDVQAANDYMSSADFGRIDNDLAKEAQLLLETVNVTAILDSGIPASVELEKFHAWKSRFIKAYLEHHAERRSADLEMARRVKIADSQHTAVKKLTAIPELSDVYDPIFATTWKELKTQVKPCHNRENEVSLQRQPYCIDCGVRLGSPGLEDEVQERISEIEAMLRRCSNGLSEIAASRVLTGEREGELKKLININSIADLTAVSHVLDDGVLSFLRRFASDSGRSG